MSHYTELALHIDGEWLSRASGGLLAIRNPADASTIGELPLAGEAELRHALDAAQRGFLTWRRTSAWRRSQILRAAAALARERMEAMAQLMTLDQGKPLSESRAEARAAADHIEWCAEEGRRIQGQVMSSRLPLLRQAVVREPVGPVAVFTPWDFPVIEAVRKIAGALAAGCSVILQAPQECPGSVVELVSCFVDAGLPAGVLNLVFGHPADAPARLIRSPVIRLVSFTGAAAQGQLLGVLAVQQAKRMNLEMGGHAPFIVFADADLKAAVSTALALKHRNAGQAWAAPSRFFIQDSVYVPFVEAFTRRASQIVLGAGLYDSSQMGPLATPERVEAMQTFVADATTRGAKVALGGERKVHPGWFFPPTVLTDVPDDASMATEPPFGPISPMFRFDGFDDVVARANRPGPGLAAYVFTRSQKTSIDIAAALDCAMVSLNHRGLTLPEAPFTSVKDVGDSSEGATQGLEAYLATKRVFELGQ